MLSSAVVAARPSRQTLAHSLFRFTFSSPPALSLGSVPAGPPDAIIGLTDAYNSSTAPHKVNVGVGAYRDDSGKPYVLPVVKVAEARVIEKGLNKEYAGIAGIAGFVDRSLEVRCAR